MAEQTAIATQKRLQILGADEIESLYGLPHFTPEEQMEHFALSARKATAIEQLHSIKSRIYAILQLGYFKARHLFFVFSLATVAADAQHIQARYFPDFQLTNLDLAKVTRLNQQRLILELCHYGTCNDEARQALIARAEQSARVCGKPIYIFRELMHDLEAKRLVAPGYTVMQNIVGQAITAEQKRLSTMMQSHLKATDIHALNQLLEEDLGWFLAAFGDLTARSRFSLFDRSKIVELLQQLLPDSEQLRLENWNVDPTNQHLSLTVSSLQAIAQCPLCQGLNRRVHSRYQRTLQDLALAQYGMTLH